MNRALLTLALIITGTCKGMEHKASLTKIKAKYAKLKDERAILSKMAFTAHEMKASPDKEAHVAMLHMAMDDFTRRAKKAIRKCAASHIKYVQRYNAQTSYIAALKKTI